MRVKVCNLIGCREASLGLFILKSPCHSPEISFAVPLLDEVCCLFSFLLLPVVTQ